MQPYFDLQAILSVRRVLTMINSPWVSRGRRGDGSGYVPDVMFVGIYRRGGGGRGSFSVTFAFAGAARRRRSSPGHW